MFNEQQKFSGLLADIEEATNKLSKIKLEQISISAWFDRIAEIALKHCADYPNIENCDPQEMLFAIKTKLDRIEDVPNTPPISDDN